MTTYRRRSRSLTTALSALVLVLLCACEPRAVPEPVDPSSSTAAEVRPRFEELELPASTRPEEHVVDHARIVGPAEGLPWYVTAVRTSPGGRSTAAVWVGRERRNGTVWTSELADPLTLPVLGDVRSVVTAADEKIAVIAGARWNDGAGGTYLFTSTDRSTWDGMDAPALDALEVRSAFVLEEVVVVVGVDREDDSVRALRVGSDGEVSPFFVDIPDDADDVVGAAVRGEEMVVLVTTSDDSGDQAVTAVRSRDGGSVWVHETVRGLDPRIAGVVALADGFVATGTTRRDLPNGPGTVATAWRVSTDDARWIASRTNDGGHPERSTGFGAPAAYRDGYAAVQWFDDAPWANVWVETARRQRSVARVDTTDRLTPAGPTAPGGDGDVLSVMAGDHGAFVVRSGDGSGEATTVASLAPAARWQDSAMPDEASADRVLVRRRELDVQDRYWTRAPRYTDLELVGERLEVRGEERHRRLVEYAPDGRAAALSLGMIGPASTDGYQMVPGVLTETGWLTSDPVEADGFAQPYDIAWVGGRWMASGVVAPGLDESVPDVAGVWVSTDGLSWEPVAGFDPGTGASEANLICPTGAEAFVLGHAEGETVVWNREGGTWHREIVDMEAGEDILDCQKGDAGALVQFRTENGMEMRSTEDALSYETLHVSGPDEYFGLVVEVDGGFAAPGYVETEGWEGQVLWLSADAEEWFWTPVPTEYRGSGVVYPVEEGLVVTIDAPGGMQAWSVPAVAEVIAARDGSTRS